jgi:CYTH domain-containing protein
LVEIRKNAERRLGELDLPGWIGKEVTNDPMYRKINMQRQHIVDLHESQAVQMTVN